MGRDRWDETGETRQKGRAMPRFTTEQLTSFSRAILESAGAPAGHAETVASHLVSCNLAGHDSHGLLRLLQYCQHVEEGRISPAADPQVLSEGTTTALLDGLSLIHI